MPMLSMISAFLDREGWSGDRLMRHYDGNKFRSHITTSLDNLKLKFMYGSL